MAGKKKDILPIEGDVWLGSKKIQEMGDALEAIYLRLLIHMNRTEDGGIKADDDKICEKVKCSRESLEYLKLHVLFEEHGRYYQKKLKNAKEDKKNKKKSKKLTEEENNHRKLYIQRYIDFFKQQTGMDKCVLDGLQLEALDTMNKILKEAKAGNTDEKVLQAFDIIYNSWPLYPPYMQELIKPKQILSNLPNMMVIIKKGYSGKQQQQSHIEKRLDQADELTKMIESRHSQPNGQ